MAAPTTTTNWGDNNVNDATYGNSKVQPTLAIRDDGLVPLGPLKRAHLNYQLDSLHQWKEYIIDELLGTGTDSVLQKVFPVGAYYMSGTSAVNPATTLGFGTWVAVEGRVLVGLDSGDTDFDTLLETGGHKTLVGQSTEDHVLTTGEMPGHSHNTTLNKRSVDGPNQETVYAPVDDGTGSDIIASDSAGGGLGHDHDLTNVTNLSPYEVCQMWRRTV